MRLNEKAIETSIFRKETNTNIYINWNSHAPMQSKIGKERNLVQRSTMICSNEITLEKEMNHLRTVFTRVHDYLTGVVNIVINDEQQKRNISNNITNEMKKNEITTNNNKLKAKQIQLLLPFSENQGTQILSKMSKDLKKCPLANVNVKTTIGYENTKLSPQFSVKY